MIENGRRYDDLLPVGGQCTLCGRYYNINEVQIGVYVDYFLLKRQECTCPTCFGEQLHRVDDPTLDDVLFSRRYCDRRPSELLGRVSVWAKHERSD
jgi:hypothetical protein